MRTANSLKNISISLGSQIIIVILGFISRKVFLDNLGAEYLGINGLLTNVLAMLALVESGIGTSIVYNLYKPLAENNKPKIIAFVQLYKKAYAILAVIIFILSISIYPLLDNLLKGESISYFTIVYFIFVGKNMITYFNAHKVSLIYADQKGYVLARVNILFQILTLLSRIGILVLTKDYVIYLLVELIVFIVQNIFNGLIVNKRYNYIKTKKTYLIDREEKEKLIKNVKALFLHNIGSYCVLGTDNILISTFAGIVTVGLYSNYSMIIGQIGSLISPLLGGVGASVGNLIATESDQKKYSIFKVIYLLNFWIYSICFVVLYNLLEPFINWWLGGGYLLDRLTFLVIMVNFYIMGLRSSISTFKIKAGIFVQDKYIPLIEAAVNLGTAIILVQYFGLAGIFIGTTISTLVTFWYAPRLVYEQIFQMPVWDYFKKYILYGILTIVACAVTTYICSFLSNENGILSLIGIGMICVIIPNILFTLFFYKTEEFKYLMNFFMKGIKKVNALFRSTAAKLKSQYGIGH
ncbi:oligosaccharide flippase family protein [Paenibacillus sp. LHD-38]|uniref:lipopolysaccharide biosynthesis protein n=1 Tax=Paenibacillus sp. LHD-38 TaxID=3072143 RepID=UPI00280FB4A7|nr:oligosaccharide flippase family protein [Paenibacillus sp. LHD-38]MDQ8735936.1 oligosaccharide flippase family protein [Paenibacillus sp. LHD-38]